MDKLFSTFIFRISHTNRDRGSFDTTSHMGDDFFGTFYAFYTGLIHGSVASLLSSIRKGEADYLAW